MTSKINNNECKTNKSSASLFSALRLSRVTDKFFMNTYYHPTIFFANLANKHLF